MRTLLLTLFSTIIIGVSFAQMPKRYVFVEHFTNTRCSICAVNNPGLFQRLDNNPGEVHHVSIHSEVPYPQCIFYQANAAGNNIRKDYYGDVFGTPTSYTDGIVKGNGSNLLPQSRIDNLAGRTSPLQIEVSELKTGGILYVTIKVRTYDVVSQTGLKLYAAVLERKVNYAAPNGEDDHYNVFRAMLPANGGVDLFPAAIGGEVLLNYQINIDPSWNSTELGTLVFIQNDATKEVLNSGTAFDIVPKPEITNADCSTASNGSIATNVTGGTPPFTYAWNTGATSATVNSLSAGAYTVTITDAANYEYIQEYDVADVNSLTGNLTYTPTSGSTGTATATPTGGTSPYTYNWGNGDMMQTATGLSAGVVNVTITDANGCEVMDSIDIQSIALQGVATDVTCYGEMDGSITINPIGGTMPFTYLWSTGGTSELIEDLSAGSYTLTLTDANSAAIEETYTINQPDSLSLSVFATGASGGNLDGTITSTVSGGTPPYSYLWNDNSTLADLETLAAGTYSLTLSDANDCSLSKQVAVDQLTSITSISKEGLKLYPNPVSNELTVELITSDEVKILLYDISGKLLKNISGTGTSTIQLNDLEAGTYLLHIRGKKFNRQERIVKY